MAASIVPRAIPIVTTTYIRGLHYRVPTMFHLPESPQLVGSPQLVEQLSLAFTRCLKRWGSSRTRDVAPLLCLDLLLMHVCMSVQCILT